MTLFRFPPRCSITIRGCSLVNVAELDTSAICPPSSVFPCLLLLQVRLVATALCKCNSNVALLLYLDFPLCFFASLCSL